MSSVQDVESLGRDLCQLIVQVANLRHLSPDQIGLDQPLYGQGVGLDSIDMLELVVNMERKYGIKLRNDDAGRTALSSVRSLAEATRNHLLALEG